MLLGPEAKKVAKSLLVVGLIALNVAEEPRLAPELTRRWQWRCVERPAAMTWRFVSRTVTVL
jgi:hypothetical protein